MNFILTSIFLLLISFLTVLIATPTLIRYLHAKKKIEIPNHRSSHTIPTPSSGGLVFFPTILITWLIIPSVPLAFSFLCICILASGVLGYLDDLLDISASKKLGFQAIIAAGIVLSGFSIHPFFTFLGFSIPFAVLVVVSILFIVSFMNAFNLIDGIDGLATGIALISTTVFGILFFLLEDYSFFVLTLSFFGALLAFLLFNFQPSKIFMGDTGSLLLATFLIVCFLRISQYSSTYSLIAVSTLIYPMIDMLRLFLGRAILYKTPFKADKNHYHHLFLQMGYTHRTSTVFICALQLIIVGSSIVFSSFLSPLLSILSMICVSLIFYVVIHFLFFRSALQRKFNIMHKLSEHIEHNHLLKKELS